MKVNKIMMEVLSIQVLRILFVIMIFIVNPQGQGGRGWRRRRRAKIHLNIVLYYWPSVASPTTSPFPDKVWVVWEEDKIRVLTKFAAGIKIKPNFKKLHKISGGERKVLSSSVFPHHSLLLLEEIFSLLLSQTINSKQKYLADWNIVCATSLPSVKTLPPPK